MSRTRSRRGAQQALIRPAVLHYTCEPLEPRTLFNVITIQAPNGNNVITLSDHVRLGVRLFVDYTINGGATQSIGVVPTDSIFVDTGNGEDQVNVVATLPSIPTTIQGHSTSDDILSLGGPSGMQAIGGSITLHNSAGFWDIMADDSANATSPRIAALNGTSLSGLAPGTISWDAGECHGISINTGSVGGNALNVLATPSTTQIQGHSSGPDDSLTLGNSTDGLGDIVDLVTINQAAQPAGLTNLTFDDQANPRYENYILDNGSLSTGTTTDSTNFTSRVAWGLGSPRAVTLKSEGQGPDRPSNVLQVENTNAPTAIVGDSAGLLVGVSETVPGHTPQGILGSITVTNPAGSTDLIVRSPASTPGPLTALLHNVMLPGDSASYGQIDGLWPATIAFRNADTARASFAAQSNAGDVVDIAATATNVLAGGPAVVVGDAGSLQNIAGTLKLVANAITLDDSADSTARNATLSIVQTSSDSFTSIAGLSPAEIHLSFPDPNLIINGGTGANTYSVVGPPVPNGSTIRPHTGIVLNTGSGNDTVQVSGTGFGKTLVINGQGGNDAFAVHFTSLITDDLVLSGGSGSSTFTLFGAPGAAPLAVTSGTIVFGSITLTFLDIKTLVFSDSTFSASGELGGINLSTSGTTTVTVQGSTHLGTLSIGAGSQVLLAPGAMPLGSTLFLTGLSIDPAGKLDLANNSLQLSYADSDPAATVHSYLASGFAGGTWSGNGIMTSTANAGHTLGAADSADGLVSGLPANTILVRYTRYGDVNLDGAVGFGDLLLLAQHYGQTGARWSQGDQNYDGTVGFGDLLLLAQNYGQSLTATATAMAASVDSIDLLPRKAARKR